jgi:hypothetical protein
MFGMLPRPARPVAPPSPGASGRPGRRALLLAVAGLAPAAPAALAARAPLRFRILREGAEIGTHLVTFSGTAEAPIALTEVDIAVRLAGFTVFRMRHSFRESWAEGRLREAASRLDRNGRVSEMAARAEGDAILVEGTAGAQRLPREAAPLTWWETRRFGGPLFDNATGRPLRLQWTRTPAAGGMVRWRCTGDTEAEGLYAADGTWLSWATRGDDGSAVTYERA